MKTSNNLKLALVLVVLGAVGTGAWWLGLRQGMTHTAPAASSASAGAATAAAAQAKTDPDNWTIAQGEEATRRHVREGLKAGDMDPVTGRKILNYHDPMVPGKNFEAPGKSPFMDMMLAPRYAGSEGADASSVTVSARIQQNLGLRTVAVVQGVLAPELSAVGNVAWNEREQRVLSARAMGYVEKLHVRATLDRVQAGAPLADLYVPEWVTAQEEYLALARLGGAGVQDLRDAARQRMRQVGMAPEQIERVVTEGSLQPQYTLRAPITGIVSELAVREGATVSPGMLIARVQGTGTVWAEGQFPESQAALLRVGDRVLTTSPAAPGQTFTGRVQALLPEVDPVTRTLRARVELDNPQARLVPGMQVQLRVQRAPGKPVLLVPTEAVIHTGTRSVVMLAEDEGRYQAVQVQTGQEAGGQTEIRAGLQSGQRVVVSGQFLIDSEASLRGLQARLQQTGTPRYTTEAVIDELGAEEVTLTHPAIAALKWPAMQMAFKLPPAAQRPRGLRAGDKVMIEFETQDGDVPQITRLQPLATGSKP